MNKIICRSSKAIPTPSAELKNKKELCSKLGMTSYLSYRIYSNMVEFIGPFRDLLKTI